MFVEGKKKVKGNISHGPNTGGVKLLGEPVVDEAIESAAAAAAAAVTKGASTSMDMSRSRRGVVLDMVELVGRGRG